jgi:hypothetical protein
MSGEASATAVTTSEFTFSNVDTTVFGVPADFGSLTVGTNQSGFTTLTLSPTTNNTFFDTDALDLNLASGILVTGTSVSGSSGTITVNNNVSAQNDGFGTFNTQINIFDGPNSGISSGETLTVTLNTTLTDLTQILAANDNGFDASGHVFNSVLGGSCTIKVGEAFPGATTSGGASSGDTSQCDSANVPEPQALAMLGSSLAMLGIVGIVRRRRRSW